MMRKFKTIPILFSLFLPFLSSFTVTFATTRRHSTQYSTNTRLQNPFTPKASLIRYWNNKITTTTTNRKPPDFLLSKSSPLSATEAAFFAALTARKSLPFHLSSFCAAANLFCFVEPAAAAKHAPPAPDANFTSYSNQRFSNYGASRLKGADSFKNYSDGLNFASGSFSKYSRSSTGHTEKFTNYAPDGNIAASNFTSYGNDATGGSGEFSNYAPRVNVPRVRFASYDSEGNNHKLSFASYTEDTNSGSERFVSYANNGNGVPVEFRSYGGASNVIGSSFTGYGENGNAANDSFKAYTSNSNNPRNNFRSYGNGGNSAVDTFSSYRNRSNSGSDSFRSYAKDSNSGKVNFVNYGKTVGVGTDLFKEYAKGTGANSIDFKTYGFNTTFKEYAEKGVTFAQYVNSTSSNFGTNDPGGVSVNNLVEPGKFFREYMLKEGTVMEMPDIADKMPERSFLPKAISSKLPFSTSDFEEIKHIFDAKNNSAMEHIISNALTECERPPSRGEMKRCVTSAEDMIDFAVSVLGHDVVVRTTENVIGSKQKVLIGEVREINGGDVTESVSCHQSLYPYLVYYCHSVPRVRVYVADILDMESNVKVNEGVAICHVDTSDWGPNHGAFIALESSPGLIEVCHWIYENDMTWTIEDC